MTGLPLRHLTQWWASYSAHPTTTGKAKAMSDNDFPNWRDFEDGNEPCPEHPDRVVAFEGVILELGIGSLFIYVAPDHVRYSEPFDMLDPDDREGIAKIIAAEVMRDAPESMHETLFATFVESLAEIAEKYRLARELRNVN